MACCLTVPSHYQNNQCSYLICDGPWNLVENNSTVSLQVTILHSEFEKCTFKVTTIYPRGQWLDLEKKIIVIVHLPDTKTMTKHNSDVKMDADQRKHQSSASLPFVRGIHRWPVNSPHKRQVTRKFSIWWRHHDVPRHYHTYHGALLFVHSTRLGNCLFQINATYVHTSGECFCHWNFTQKMLL